VGVAAFTLDAGIIQGTVELAIFFDGLSDHRIDVVPLRDVGFDEDSVTG